MKLVDLLVKELPKRGGWPAGVDAVEQDCEGELFEKDSDYCSGFKLEKCDDWITDVVTKQQYESALAASKAVVGHDGWIQWAGGECPVDGDAIVEVKYRKPNPYQFNNDRAGDFAWAHDGFDGDIIAYRMHQPTKSEQVRADAWRSYAGAAETDDEADLNECIGQGVEMPEWDGEGLPPVGTVCMANLANGWTDVKVAYIGEEGGCREALVFEIKSTKPAWADEFRPLHTKAEKARELAIESITKSMGVFGVKSASELLYADIAAGKIPGVKLEDK